MISFLRSFGRMAVMLALSAMLVAQAGAAAVTIPLNAVAWYQGEGNGNDNAGATANNATLSGNVTYAAGKVGQAFSLSGVNDGVAPISIPDQAEISLTTAFTAELWIKTSTSNARIMNKFSPSNPFSGFNLDLNGNQLRCEIWDGSSNVGATSVGQTIIDNNWHHIAATYDKTASSPQLRIYLDGVQVGSATGTISIGASTTPLRIGAWSLNGSYIGYFSGLVDEPALYSRALSGAEIASIYNAGTAGKVYSPVALPANVLTLLKAENNAIDSVGSNNGTVSSVSYAAGKVGQAFSFNGTSDYLTVPGAAIPIGNNPITVEMWLYTQSSSWVDNANTVFEYDGGSGDTFALDMMTFPNLQFYAFSGNDRVFSTGLGSDTGWFHIAITHDGSTLRFYINGAQVDSVARTMATGSGGTLRIGGSFWVGSSFFDGKIDEFTTYSRALTATEILNIYNAGSAGKAVPTPVITSPTLDLTVTNNAYSYAITATGSPTTFGATGLPTGLSIDINTGIISGIPTVAGPYAISLYATNAGGFGAGTLTLKVDVITTLVSSGLDYPEAIVKDSAGNIYFGNAAAGKIQKYTVSTGVTSDFVVLGAEPSGMAIDSLDNIYANLSNTGNIKKITPGGVVTTYASGIPAEGNYGLAFDSVGNLYLASHNSGKIRKITSGGVVSDYITLTSGFYRILFDATDNLYVANADNGYIKKVTPGLVTSTFATLTTPNTMIFDPNGNMLVTGGNQNLIYKVTPTGVVTTFSTGFHNVTGIVAATDWTLYVTESFGSLNIRRVGLPGPEMDVLGNAASIVNGDVTPSTADFTDFGSVSLGSTVTRTFSVANTGTSNLSLTGTPKVAVSGTHAADFTVTVQPSSPVGASTSTTVQVQFAPSATGTRSATLTIANDDSDEGTYTFAIQGTGSVPANAVSWWRAENNATDTVGGHNGTLNGSVTYTAGVVGQAFSFPNANGNYVEVSAPYTAFTTELTVEYWVYMGSTTAQGPWLGQSTRNLDAANSPVWLMHGLANRMVQFLVWDGGTTSRGVGPITIPPGTWHHVVGVAKASALQLYLDGNLVGTSAGISTSIFSNPSAVVHIGEDPRNVGLNNRMFGNLDEVVIYNHALTASEVLARFNLVGGTPEINVVGNGQDIADGATSPTTANNTDFGNVSAPGGSLLRTFTIQNNGSAALTISSITSSSGQFVISGAPSSVAADSSATFNVTFGPSSTGVKTATITINNSDSDEAVYDFSVTGTGVVPEIDVLGNGVSIANNDSTPSTADFTDFGSAYAGGGFVTRTFTIANTGGGTLNLTGSPKVAVSGANAADFTVTVQPTSPVAGTSGTTTFQVKFSPSSTGTRTATLTIANDDSDEGTYTFAIQGAGGASSPPANSLAWWKAENNGVDSVNGNTAVLQGSAGYTAGKVGQAFNLNSSAIDVAHSASLSPTDAFTIELWVKTTASDARLVNKLSFSGTVGGYNFDIFSGYLRLEVFTTGFAGGSVYSAAANVADGNWHHVAASYDKAAGSNQLKVYLDGVQVGASTITPITLAYNASTPLRMGYWFDNSTSSSMGFFTGQMDEVTLYGTALTASDIQGIYNAGTAGKSSGSTQSWNADTGNGNGSGNTTADNLRIRRNGSNIEFSADGGTTWTASTPYSTTSIVTLTGSNADDTFVIDFSGGNPIPSGGITVAGSGQVLSDKLVVTGGAFGTVTHNLTNAHDGSVTIAGLGTINYTGLEPVDMTGSTIADLIFNLPAGPSNAILGDDGTAANGISRFSSSPVTFESTDFSNPSGSLTINRGNAGDTVTINATPDFTATLTVGASSFPVANVTVAGALTLAADKNFTVYSSGTVNFSTSGSDVTLSGTGVASVTTARDITFASGASLTTVNGNLTLSANQQGSPTSGAFVGVDVNGGTVQSTGSGSVTVSGKGGDVGTGGTDARRYGVELRNSGHIFGGTSGTCLVQGTGGTNPGWRNYGIHMLDAASSITSSGANVQLTGLGGGTGSGSNEDVGIWLDAGLVSAGGTGTVLVQGTGATAAVLDNNHHGIHLVAAAINSTGGAVTVTGVAGGGAGGGNNIGVVLLASSTISAGGATSAVTVTGTGGAGNGGYGVALIGAGAKITSSGGDVLVTGTASQIAASSIRGIWMVTATPSITTALNGGNLTLVADSMDIANGTISANAASTVTLRPKTAGTVVNLGGADAISTPNTLGLTSAELAAVSAGTVIIGHTSSAALTVSATITHADASALSIVAGTGLNINLNASVRTAGGPVTFNNAVVLGASATVDTTNSGGTPAGGSIGFASTINLGANLLTLNGGAVNYSIGGVISGTGGQLTKQGTGTLTLSGGNSFTGNVIVSAGTVKLANTTALGAANTAATKVTVASGATVDFNGSTDIAYGYTIAGTGVGGNGALVNTGSLISNGVLQTTSIKLSADASIGGTSGWSLLAAAYSPTSLDLAGFTLTKVGANTIYFCNTTLTAGTVRVSGGTLGTVHTAVDGSAAAFVLDNTAGARLSLTDDLGNGAAALSVGSLSGAGATGGNVDLGAVTLTVGALNTSTTYAGIISGTGGQLTKLGTGTLTLSGTNTYTGATSVSNGKLLVNGSLATAGTVTIANGGTLGGSGTVGVVTAQSGGSVSPGSSPGILNVGNTTFNSGSTFVVEINGTTAGTGYDQLNVTGTINLGGATLSLSGSFTPSAGQTYTIIANDLGDAVTGTFNGLAEGAIISNFLGSGLSAQISYVGGSGNDVTLKTPYPAAWSAATGNGNGVNNGTADSFWIRRNGANIELSADNGTTWPVSIIYSITTVLTLNGSNDDDTFVIDYSGGNPVPSGGVTVVGGGQVTTGDSIKLISGTHTTVTYGFVNNNDGSIDLDGSVVSYTGLEPIIDNTDAVNRIFTYTGGAETITVRSFSATQTKVDSTLGESVTFNNPTATMTINAGTGDDTILLYSLSSGWAATVTINGDAGDDIIQLNKTVATLASITVNGNAHTIGDTLNFDREGDATIVTSGASPGTVTGGSPAIQTVNYNTVETINNHLYGSIGDAVIADRGPYFSTGTILLYKAAKGTQAIVNTTIKDPYEIDLDTTGKFVIADYEVNAGTAGIYTIDRFTGNKTTNSANGSFSVPFGIKVDKTAGVNAGKYIVADLDADNNGTTKWGAIFVVNPATASPGNQTKLSSRSVGTGTDFYWLTGLALGSAGDIYVCDQGDQSNPATQPPRIFHVNPTTGNRTVIAQGGTLRRPIGLAVISGTGVTAQLVVVDAGLKRLFRFTGTGSVITPAAGDQLVHSGVTFDQPTHIALDRDGNYIITDAPVGASAGQRRVHRMDSTTLVVTPISTGGFLEQPRGTVVVP